MFSSVAPMNTYIQYVDTKYTIEARKVLKLMVESLEGEELKFAKEHLVELLKPLNGDFYNGLYRESKCRKSN